MMLYFTNMLIVIFISTAINKATYLICENFKAREVAVVVLPHPPFSLRIAKILHLDIIILLHFFNLCHQPIPFVYNKSHKVSNDPMAYCLHTKTQSNCYVRLSLLFFGGDEGDRTLYLLTASQALSQVSYTPIFTFLDIFVIYSTFFSFFRVCYRTACSPR